MAMARMYRLFDRRVSGETSMRIHQDPAPKYISQIRILTLPTPLCATPIVTRLMNVNAVDT